MLATCQQLLGSDEDNYKQMRSGTLKWTVLGMIVKFLGIFSIIFLSQIPRCVVVLADEAGQIDFFEYQTLIALSQFTFAFPLRLFVEGVESTRQLLTIYLANLLLLSAIVFLILSAAKRAKRSFFKLRPS